jgi:hypothetical protein
MRVTFVSRSAEIKPLFWRFVIIYNIFFSPPTKPNLPSFLLLSSYPIISSHLISSPHSLHSFIHFFLFFVTNPDWRDFLMRAPRPLVRGGVRHPKSRSFLIVRSDCILQYLVTLGVSEASTSIPSPKDPGSIETP